MPDSIDRQQRRATLGSRTFVVTVPTMRCGDVSADDGGDPQRQREE